MFLLHVVAKETTAEFWNPDYLLTFKNLVITTLDQFFYNNT